MPGIHLRNQVTPFVVLFIERDGSTYLINMLKNHPEINADYERLDVMRQENKTAAEQLAWVNEFLTPPLISKYKAIGFKTKLKDVLDLEGFARLLPQKQTHIIHMQRRNVIKAVVSRVNARRLHDKIGVWNLYDEADRLAPAMLDYEQFDTMVRNREAQDKALSEFVARFDLPKMVIAYEDLLQDRDRVLHELFDFLRIRWVPLEATTKKNTGDDLRQAIANYDEIRERYAGTRYEAMFDEVLVS